MQVVYFLVPIGLFVLALAIWAFCWAVNNGQFNDIQAPAHQVVFDDQEEQIQRGNSQ